MFGLKKKISLVCVGLLLSLPISVSSVKADDMEIYNMTSSNAAAGDVNIIFMLDNSGSMKWCIDSTDGSNCSDAANTRMFALRKAMAQVLAELEDTTKVAIFTYGRKVAWNRYGDVVGDTDGGSMLAPLRALNETLPDGVTTHREYLTNWFEDSTKTDDDRYKISNYPANWSYNFGPSSPDTLHDAPPGCTSASGSACTSYWDTHESNLIPQNNTPLESAYAEIGAYLLGQKVSSWGNTYFARTGSLVKVSKVGSTDYYSATDSTLNVTSTSPLTLSGSDYFYRQPDYTVQQTCAAPSWHIILVTDGEPTSDSNKEMFKQVMGTDSTCSTSTTWSCSKELALFLANKSLETQEYSWTCSGNCDAYLNSDGDSVTPTAPTDMSRCDTTSDAGNTTTTNVNAYSASIYDWTCASNTTTNYAWNRTGSSDCGTGLSSAPTCDASNVNSTVCLRVRISGSWRNRTHTCTGTPQTSYAWNCTSASSGGSCTDSNKPEPSSRDCNSSGEVGDTAQTQGSYSSRTVSWTCNVETDSTSYDNGLGVKIKTDAIFVGPDASSDAIKEMTNITNNGDGVFNKSTSVDDLIDALMAAIAVAEKEPNTVSAPGVAVNQLSRFQHLDQLYYSVFQPAATGVWEGNLKRFLLEDSTVKDSQKQDAVDSGTKFFKLEADSCWGVAGSSSKQPAGCTGYTVNDGKDSTLGGMRSMLDASTRNILTTTDGTSVVTLESLRLADSTNLTANAGYLGYSSACASSTAPYCNGDITALGGDAAGQIAEFNTLIDWGKGVRATGNFSMLAADPLHSQPVLVNYGFTGDSGSGSTRQTAFDTALADGSLQENYVFFSTNGGVLHGVDANTGEEKFAFIPKEMLPLIPKTENVPTWTGTASRLYGLDSTWVSWRRDANNDGDIKDGSTEWAYLFGGMRMGGSNYYALDTTDIDSPDIKWTIKGPLAGGFLTTTDGSSHTVYRPIAVASVPTGTYRWMGQTWSKPVLARLALNDGASGETGRTVLIFGGGYDPTNETQRYLSGTTTVTPASTFGTDAYGHQLYVVDAKTGDLLFWASGGSGTYGTGTTTNVTEAPSLSVSDMKYSITGSPSPVDRDGDGYTDLIYFADLGGQVFRMDLKNKGTNNGTGTTCTSTISSTCNDLVMRVAKIASLGEAETASSVADQRRFFEAPGIGILQRPNGSQYMGVAIGSGNRSHPAGIGTQDRIYVFEDSTALTANLGGLGTISALTHTNLQDVTSYSYDTSTLASFTGKNGFYINISEASGTGADGEKVFSTPLIFQGLVYLTSYIPETGVSTSSNQCSPGTGSSSLYIFNVFDGRAETDDASDLLDRTVEGITSTITGDVQIVFNSDGTSTILAGTYAEDAGSSNKGIRRTRWYENPHY